MDKSENNSTVKEKLNLSAIQQFYKGKVVFVTGGTGFLGKLLVNKLIRLDVKEIVLLSRPKKEKTIAERIEIMFNDVVFENLSRQFPKFRENIRIFDGDMQQEDLGFTEDAQEHLINHAQIVLHAAADVRFDQTLKKAVEINVRGTRDLLKLVSQFKKLEAFVYVSTAYSNCNQKTVKEIFYPPPASPEKMIKFVEQLNEKLEKSLETVKTDIIHPWPNTYSYSKALTEDVVRHFGDLIPTAVVRPSIVISTISDPLEGWSDNIYGVNGVLIGVALGLIRVMRADVKKKADLIPADIVIDAILAAAHRIFEDTKVGKSIKMIPETKIYNCISNTENPITWQQIHSYSKEIGDTMPPLKSLWYIVFVITKSKFMIAYYKIFYHLLPALLMDTYLRLINRTPRLMKLYKKIHKFSDVLEYFSTQEWVFENKNMVDLFKDLSAMDKKMFPCTAKRMVWKEFFYTYLKGTRMYILKESMDNQVEALKKYRKMKILHYTVVNCWRLLVLYLIYTVLKFFGVFSF